MRLLLWRTQSVGHTKVQSNKNNNEIKRMNPNKKERESEREKDTKETKGKGNEMNRFLFGIIMSFISEFFFYFLHF